MDDQNPLDKVTAIIIGDAMRRELAAHGLAIVPVAPTEAMVEAAKGWCPDPQSARNAWRFMVAAALSGDGQ